MVMVDLKQHTVKGSHAHKNAHGQVLSKYPKFRGLKGYKVTPRQSVLAARIVVESDARNGRPSEQKFIDLAKTKILAPNGEELVFKMPKNVKVKKG